MKKNFLSGIYVPFLCILMALVNLIWLIYKHYTGTLEEIVFYGFMAVLMVLFSIWAKITKE